jgi:hypothetical protein
VTIASGTKLGRYDVRSHLGAGAMGEVYLAQDKKIGFHNELFGEDE